jgi:hydrogenase/urease accessory protein HupE
MNRRVSDLLGFTRPPGEDTPLWSGIAAAFAAVFGALLALLVGLPSWTVILLYGVLAWRLATDPPEHKH